MRDKIYKKMDQKIDRETNVLISLKNKLKDGEDRKVMDEVFDHQTLLALHKLFANNVLVSIDYPISTGKEANVFKGRTEKCDVAIKIYRVSNATYKNFYKYIAGDPRFRKISMDYRKLVYVWTQKEFKNLSRLHEVGVNVPKPITYYNNILLMEYIGDETSPAPALRNVTVENPKELYETVVEQLVTSYKKAGLVHGDLSEYNILMFNGKPRFIDVSQAVLKEHPMCEELINRDVNNIVRYFRKLGVDADRDEILRKMKSK